MYDFLFCQRNIQQKKNHKNLINFFARNFSWVSILFFFLVFHLIFSVVVFYFCLFVSKYIYIFFLFIYWAYEFISFRFVSFRLYYFWVSFFLCLLCFIFISVYCYYCYGFQIINVDFPPKYEFDNFYILEDNQILFMVNFWRGEEKKISLHFFITLYFLYFSFFSQFYLSFYF